jgi:chromate transporter
VNTWQLVRAWVAIGVQSVGGGSATLYLMRRTFVERAAIIPMRDFMEDWALSRLSPGIHMVAQAALMGRRLAGARGVAIAVLGMMLPSGIITAALTAGYGAVRDQPLIARAVAGMGPIALGLSLGTTLVLIRATARGGRRAIVDWAAFAAVIGLGILAQPAPIPVFIASIAIGAAFLSGERAAKSETPMA